VSDSTSPADHPGIELVLEPVDQESMHDGNENEDQDDHEHRDRNAFEDRVYNDSGDVDETGDEYGNQNPAVDIRCE
jgi:hypothetical protein